MCVFFGSSSSSSMKEMEMMCVESMDERRKRDINFLWHISLLSALLAACTRTC
jgi:hypothetical protein